MAAMARPRMVVDDSLFSRVLAVVRVRDTQYWRAASYALRVLDVGSRIRSC